MAKRYGSHWAVPTFPGWWLQLQLRTSLTRFGSEYCRCVEKTSTSYHPSPSIFLAKIGICLWSPSPRWRNNRAQKQVVNVYLFLSYARFPRPWHPLFDCSCCQTYQLPKVEVWTDGLFKHYSAVFQTSHWNMGTKSLDSLRPWPMVRGAMSPAWCKRLHRKCKEMPFLHVYLPLVIDSLTEKDLIRPIAVSLQVQLFNSYSLFHMQRRNIL